MSEKETEDVVVTKILIPKERVPILIGKNGVVKKDGLLSDNPHQ